LYLLKKIKINEKKKQFLPKELRRTVTPMNSKIVWNFIRGANVQKKEFRFFKMHNRVLTFEYNHSEFFKRAYENLIVGRVAGIVICPKSHLYKFSNNWFHAMRTLRPRVFVGALLNKSTNGKVHNILLRCKIAKAYFRMQFNLNAPNVLSFFSDSNTKNSKKHASKHSSLTFKYHANILKRSLSNKYGSYNKRKR